MVDLLEEVQEDFQNERTLGFVKTYGRKIILLMCAVIICLTLKTWWEDYKINMIHKEGGQFITAVMKMRANKLEESVADFEILTKNGTSIYSSLAGMNIAAYKEFQRDFKLAEESYSHLANKNSISPILKQYAELMHIKTQLSDSTQDKIKLLERLKKMQSKHNPFNASVVELIGALNLDLNNITDAQAAFSELLEDKHTPHSIRIRITSLQELIS